MHKCWFLWGGSAGTFSLPPDSIHFCAAVKLGSEETEEKSIHVSVWPLIFSLLPSFSLHLHHPISPSRLFILSQMVHSGQSILTPSTGQVRRSNIPWIQTFLRLPIKSRPPRHAHFSTLSFLSFNHLSPNNPHLLFIISLFTAVSLFLIFFFFVWDTKACLVLL